MIEGGFVYLVLEELAGWQTAQSPPRTVAGSAESWAERV